MGTELQTIERGREMAQRVIDELPFAVGTDALSESKKHMALAFGRASRDLFQCTEESIGYAIALSAMSGLYPGGPRPDVWLIPRKNKRNENRLEVNWQIASRGYQRLARGAGFDVRAHVVHAHDAFDYEASEPTLTHRPDVDKTGTWETIRLGYLKVVDDRGGLDYVLLRKDQITKRRRCAQDDSIWTKWPEEQTLKTLHAYGGARETWPTTPQSRFAMAASDQMETGGIVTLHESDGRQLLAADIAPEPAPEGPLYLDEIQVNALRAIAKGCGVTMKRAFGRVGWDLPTEAGTILASQFSEIERAIRVTGVKNGACQGCGEVCETTHCSPECEAAGTLED